MTTSGATEVGYLNEIYYDADGDIATPTWVLIPSVQDVQPNLSKNKTEVPVRNEPYVGIEVTHTIMSFDVTITRRNGNSDYDALKAAFLNNTRIGIASMTGPIANSGETGHQFEALISEWAEDQSHEGNTATFTVEPASGATTPAAFVTIA